MAARILLVALAACCIGIAESFSTFVPNTFALAKFRNACAMTPVGLSTALFGSRRHAHQQSLVAMSGAPEVRRDRAYKNTVLVAGSTGRVGSLVLQEVLTRFPSSKIRAVVRSEDSIEKLKDLIETDPSRVEVVVCDLNKRKDVESAVQGVNQVVWCASGLAPPRGNVLSKLAFVAKFKISSLLGRSLDVRGPRIMCQILKEQPPPPSSTKDEGTTTQTKPNSAAAEVPRFVMLSSAAVTRPSWSDEKKEQFSEAANIPIVKLNPLGVLGLKLKGENNVRSSGLSYTIVRSCGITTNHTAGQAFQVSTGDTAVGQIHPSDLSVALATVLGIPEASGKTVELRTEGAAGFFGRGTKSELTAQLAEVAPDGGAS